MLPPKFRSSKVAHEVTVSLISCTNLKISSEAASTDDVKLYASFIANNEGIPLTVDGVEGITDVISKPLMRTHAVDTTAMWGNDKQAHTSAQFSITPQKKSNAEDVIISLGLIRDQARFPLAITCLHIDLTREDCILTLPVQEVLAEKSAQKKRSKLVSFLKRKLKKKENDAPTQPKDLNHFEMKSSAHGAKLNVRVQVKGEGESRVQELNTNNNDFVAEERHDIEAEEVVTDEDREEFCAVSEVEDDLAHIMEVVEEEIAAVDDDDDDDDEIVSARFPAYEPNTFIAGKAAIKRQSLMENVLGGFTCGDIFTCEGSEKDSQSELYSEQSERSVKETVDKELVSDLKKVVENVRSELDLGSSDAKRAAKLPQSKEDDSFSVDVSTVGTSTIGTYTVGTYTVGTKLRAIEEDTVEESTDRERTVTFHEDDSKQGAQSCDDTFTAFDNLTAYTEDVTTAFGTRTDQSETSSSAFDDLTAYTEDVTLFTAEQSFMGRNVFL